jgi:hypothetical protein
LDQFPQGIWGASLEKTVAKYGHAGDPGSISVSTASCMAIAKYSGTQLTPCASEAIDRFGKYLAQRQHSESGAFGMRKQIGTPKFPQIVIQEHGRHTATGLKFYLFHHGHDHPAARGALQYLLDNRTPSGLWIDVGPLEDRNTDPLTVAYVVETLNDLREIDNTSLDNNLCDQISKAISQGLEYLFINCSLKNQYGWTFKITDPSQREQLTAMIGLSPKVKISPLAFLLSRRS